MQILIPSYNIHTVFSFARIFYSDDIDIQLIKRILVKVSK